MGAGRRAGSAAVPAVQQRHLDQSVDRQLDLSRRLRPRREALQRRLLASWRTTPFRSSSTTSSRPTRYGATGQLHGRLQSPSRQRPERQRRPAPRRRHRAVRAQRLEVRHPPDPRVRPALHGRHGRQHDQRVQRRAAPPESPAEPGCSRTRPSARWFDTSAFAAPAPFTFGNSPRDGLRAAPLYTTDVTVERGFRFTERLRADLRAEIYNLLNRANFDLPGRTLGAADFGVVSAARSARYMQLALRLSF